MSNDTMSLQINNHDSSSVPNDRIWVSLISAAGQYLDIPSGQLKPWGDGGSISTRLSDISGPIGVPAMKSARIYFFVGAPGTQTDFPLSGPSPSKPADSKNPPGSILFYDKIEFDTSTPDWYNLNQTNVDMYGLSYTFSVVPQGGTRPITRGSKAKRSDVIGAFQELSSNSSHYGNPIIFKNLLVQNLAGSNILRVLAPASAAYLDCSSNPSPTNDPSSAAMISRYFELYVAHHCLYPGRSFTFKDKNYQPVTGTVDHNRATHLSRNGTPFLTVNLPADPNLAWPKPMNDPTNWHNYHGSVDTVDWGFVLAGAPQANVNPGSDAAYGWVLPTSDPAVMAIAISICRGVMHLDGSAWTDPTKYYQGNNGVETPDYPIYHYAKILHEKGLPGGIYALSYDDVYGQDSNVKFDAGATVTVDLWSLETVQPK